jgi:hypothetical protein
MNLEAIVTRILGLLICFFLSVGTFTAQLSASTRQYQKAVVVSAQKYEPITPRRGKHTDAPPPGTEYDYDVAIRLNCSVYVGRYQSAIEYLPAVFSPNQPVEVSLEKQLMYVKVPGSRDVKMGIVERRGESGDSCNGAANLR